ncbi:SRPBCC family protein [Paractinoplanes toevensis]|uniref:Carbon monoxide dehydrogenase subunit G n=1 Tax=Paractinoplanes toevensis TaxID=571911 RepID=A0A919T740_9ACTN|nr:SRPBCC family protein [Actinoplanes toevensis]GIM90609.1 hypothetical protein Ato02nite_024020 [Actinoplanes toevensis]
MKITNEFTVHTPIDRAWQVLTDLSGIAPCMPGAQLTGVDGDVYQGKVKIKVGPVISEFAGTARFTEKDDAAYRAVIDAKGRDARSAGNASALVTAVLVPAGESTTVSVDTDLKISGKLAQFGSGMIKEVSGKLLAQFVANLEAKLAADAEPAAASEPATDAAPATASSDAAPATASSAAVAAAPDTAIPSASVSPVPTPAPPVSSTPVIPAADAPASAPAAGSVPTPRAPIDADAGRPAASATAAAGAVPTPGAAIDADPAPEPVAAIADPAASPAAAFLADADAHRAAATTPLRPAASGPAASVTAVSEEAEPLDLLSLAGGSIYKRVVPLVAGVVVAGAVIAWLVARR